MANRIAEYAGQADKKCVSSSMRPSEHTLHILLALSVPMCLPFSISSLWLEHRNLVRSCRCLNDGKSKYLSRSNLVLVLA